ncbi:MAG: flagellar biosynthesis protein FlhB [Rhodospirillaceae bacterium]
MADDQNSDKSQKTEEATARKLEQAREKGQMPNSREVSNWFMILSGTIIVAMISPALSSGISDALRKFLESPHEIRIDDASLGDVLGHLATQIGFLLIVPILLLIVAALSSGMVQGGIVVAVDRITPKLERISPLAGIKRLFSLKSVAEFIKGLVKIAIVATVATMLMIPYFGGLEDLMRLDLGALSGVLHSLTTRLLVGVLAVVTVVAVVDFLYQKFEFMKQMRMSRQEIKDEYKQTEGDPMIKGRLRQIRQERARQRMASAVPQASVIVTNPKHFAVALKYELNEMDAPVLVAKGQDLLALKIREIATAHGIPIVENPPLARVLYAGVDIDQEIPPEHYKAVAEIIGYVMRLRGRLSRPRR